MSFMDAKFSRWGEVATAVLPQSLAKRFARVMLTAVLAVSFLPVAAFADTGGDSELKGIKGKTVPIFWYEKTSYQNLTERSSYVWSWEKDGETGAITVTETDDPSRVTVTGTEIGSVILKVSGGGKPSESITIEIRKRTVNLSSSYGEKIYDGTPLTVEGVNEDGEGWISADRGRVKYTMTGSQTNAGKSDNTFDVEFPSGSEEYFKEHYDITIRYNTLNVTERPVTLTSASGSKEYDGEPLTNHEVTVGEAAWGTGWVDGQGATYSFTGSQKIVGSSENTFECIPNEGTNLDNYDIKTEFGTLTVTDRSEKYQITLTPNSKSVTYDGTEKSVSGFETLEFQINGQTFYVSGVEASATGTDTGEYPVTESGQAVVTDVEGNDVTDQFIVNIDDAKLTIVKDDSDKSASNLPHTGDSAALYLMGICAVVLTAGAGTLFTFRKRNSYK